jgi:hypothetical protein
MKAYLLNKNLLVISEAIFCMENESETAFYPIYSMDVPIKPKYLAMLFIWIFSLSFTDLGQMITTIILYKMDEYIEVCLEQNILHATPVYSSAIWYLLFI